MAQTVNNDTYANYAGTPVMTAPGVNGAQTINAPAGSVNFAPATSTLVVTNSLVTANSLVFTSVQVNDATLNNTWAVPASGSFTIMGNAPATAATRVGFVIVS